MDAMWTSLLVFSFGIYAIINGEVFEAEVVMPTVLTTWKFANATSRAWKVLVQEQGSAIDAVEAGCAVCEYEQCDYTVGYGGSPDENGESTLDSMIMDGTTMKMGAVGGLRRIKNAIGVARKVFENTEHSFLVGDLATEFGIGMGFKEENLSTPYSVQMHENWLQNQCQPNFRKFVSPDPKKNCGPYRPIRDTASSDRRRFDFGEENHDTIGMVAIDQNLSIASGTSTNGARFKVPGRVGDSPIAGAGSYADSEIGGAAATGDGDVMMRFLPSFVAVEEMKKGRSPERAAQEAINRIKRRHLDFRGAVIALRKDGKFGAACAGMETFPYCAVNYLTGYVRIFYKKCQ